MNHIFYLYPLNALTMYFRRRQAMFTTIAKNRLNCWYRQAAFNIAKGLRILNHVELYR